MSTPLQSGNLSSTQHFTSRVKDYRKYRPSYPSEVVPYLVENANLSPQSTIADIGSGTGLITAAQAFHWFDHPKAKLEFQRILKPGGMVTLIWNTRDQSDPIIKSYEEIVDRYCPDHDSVVHTKTASEKIIEKFFAPNRVKKHTVPNTQILDYPALEGRLLSSSYAPQAGHPNHDPMLVALKVAFDEHQQNGLVELMYTTEVFLGNLDL